MRANNQKDEASLKSVAIGRSPKRDKVAPLPELSGTAAVLALLDQLPLSRQEIDKILPARGSKISTPVRFGLLQHVDSEARLAFFRGVVARVMSEPKELEVLCAVIRRAGHYLATQERLELAKELGDLCPKKLSFACWLALAASSRGLPEAARMIAELGRDNLMRGRNKELREFVARVELLQKLRLVVSNYNADKLDYFPRGVAARQLELGRLYGAVATVLKNEHWARGTDFHKHLLKIKADSRLITKQLTITFEGQSDLANALLDDLARVRFVFCFGTGLKAEGVDRGQRWSSREIALLQVGIRSFGEHETVSSGAILEVIKTAPAVKISETFTLGEYCGSTRRIWFSPECLRSKNSRGKAEPNQYMMHEIAHAATATEWHSLLSRNPALAKGQSLTHLDFVKLRFFPSDLMRIGSWHTHTGRYQVDEEDESVKIGNEWLPLGVPVDVQGQTRVYGYDRVFKLLVYHIPIAGETPKSRYGRSEPAEYVAEGLADYFTQPRVLVAKAPQLFLHWDSIFHRYSRDKQLVRRAANSLDRRIAQGSTHAERAAGVESIESLGTRVFSLLSPAEQAVILDDLGLESHINASEGTPADARRVAFASAVRRKATRQSALAMSLSALADYNPAFTLSLAALRSGDDLMVVSMRGSTQSEPNSQDPLRACLGDLLGDDFDRKQIYLLNQHGKSHRFKGTTYHDRLQELIEERLLGCSLREGREVKTHGRRYQKVIFYSTVWPTLERIRLFSEQRSLGDSLQVIDVRSISSREALNYLGKSRRGYSNNAAGVLHIMSLEQTLLNIPALIRIRHRETNLVYRELTIDQFLLKDQPSYWLGLVANQKQVSKQELFWDISDLTDGKRLRDALRQGGEENWMLKAYRQ